MCTCVYIHSVSFVTVENLDEYKPKCGWLHSMGSSLELSEKEKLNSSAPSPTRHHGCIVTILLLHSFHDGAHPEPGSPNKPFLPYVVFGNNRKVMDMGGHGDSDLSTTTGSWVPSSAPSLFCTSSL